MEVKVIDVRKHYGSHVAVDGVSFSFASGQIVGFIGPNGAGKTTTIKMIATLHEPTSGDILFDRFSILEEPEEARRAVGYMPDSLPTHRDTTVHEYLDFFARAYGLRGHKRKEVVEQVEEFTQLSALRDKVLYSLSKGMKQRVSLARALVHDPQILIMDEPAAGLDPRARIELRELLKILAEQGKAILLSSHILTELAELCTHAVFIEKGQVLKAGSLEELARKASPKARKAPPRPAVVQPASPSQEMALPTGIPSAEAEEDDDEAVLTTLLIRVLDGSERLAQELELLPHVEEVHLSGRYVEVEVDGGDKLCRALLKELIQRDFPIVEFHQQGNRLEELFMNITKGQVQ